jgi:hypothetical protein
MQPVEIRPGSQAKPKRSVGMTTGIVSSFKRKPAGLIPAGQLLFLGISSSRVERAEYSPYALEASGRNPKEGHGRSAVGETVAAPPGTKICSLCFVATRTAKAVIPWNPFSLGWDLWLLAVNPTKVVGHFGCNSARRCRVSCANGSCRPAVNARSRVSRPFASCLVCSCAIPR